MPFDDLSHAEAGDDLLLRGGGVNEYRGCGFVLENLLAELVLFCSAQDLFHVLWFNGQQNTGQFRSSHEGLLRDTLQQVYKGLQGLQGYHVSGKANPGI